MTPYWQSADRAIVVYCARWEDVLAAGLIPVRDVALVHDDPPYGMQMSLRRGGRHDAPRPSAKMSGGRVRQFPACEGDGKPYDPAPVLALQRPTVTWGANHYASRLPDSKGTIVWDKREDLPSDDGSDGEIAWTNIGRRLVIFRHWWRGALRKTEKEDKHLHINQKPVALSTFVYTFAGLKAGSLVLVPHMGSGPDIPAMRAMGLRGILCDVSEECCRVAIGARCGAVTDSEASKPAGPLFAPRQ